MRKSSAVRPLGKALALLLILSTVLTMGCGMVSNLFGGGGGGGARDLWSDVPAMDGLQKSDLGMPLAARLAIQAMFQGSIDYIAFTTTSTPADVQAFYTLERMKAAGWTSDTPGCTGDQAGGAAGMGALCIFAKDANGKQEALVVVTSTDESSKQTQVFFARIDVSKLTTPTPQP